MAIVIESQTYASQTGLGSTLTIPNVTVSAGEKLLVGFGIRNGTGDFVTGVTYNSVSMTEEADTNSSTYGGWWSMTSPSTGTHNVVLTFFDNRDRPRRAGAFVLSGVDDDVVEATGQATGSSTSPSSSITTATDDAMIFDVVPCTDDSNVVTYASDQTELDDASVQGTFGLRNGFSQKTLATAGATTMTATLGTSTAWSSISVAVKPAAAAAAAADAVFFGADF